MSISIKIYLSFFFCLIFCISSFSQDLIRGTVIDQATGLSLPYATIFNTRTITGTATNLEGYFELPNTALNDTLEISFIGYENSSIVISRLDSVTIALKPASNIIDEIVILASDDRLYDLIQKVRKRKNTKKRSAKTYFYLESQINNQQSEVIESYYNGHYSNHGIEELELKKGRIGLDSIDGRYFLSTGTSRTFVLHDLFKSSKRFPGNPLLFNKKKLKSRYWLSSKKQFESSGGIITEIEFEAKSQYANELFNGKMQVSESGKILSIHLNKINSQIYPFIPFGGIQIKGLDMEIHKTFQDLHDEQYIKSIDFNYKVFYDDRDGNNVEISSQAYCQAFDYDALFDLPIFKFSQHMHEDYRDMTAAPYDTAFWQLFDEFRFHDKLVENEKFILNHQFNNSFVIHQDSTNINQLETPYYNWSYIRYKISPLPLDEIIKERERTFFESDLYKLNTKLYLDINEINDSIIYQLVSILDPVDTYYKLTINTNDHHFMNLYFDLMEYHKIQLDNTLKSQPLLNMEFIRETLNQTQIAYRKDLKLFLKEADRGKNLLKMAEWNDYIMQLTGVDNQIQISKK